jgi:N-acetylglucosaminyl-diphospho-decaprenol L-rhamnosyltransferase
MCGWQVSIAMSDATVIIVSWNCREYLRRCLASLHEEGNRRTCEIVVVDNASTDGSVDMVRADFAGVAVMENTRNVGFAAANNLVLRNITTSSVILLNPDTVLLPGALAHLVAFMGTHPHVWAAGPALLNGDGSPQRTGVRFPSIWNLLVESVFLDRLFSTSRLFGRHRELYADPAVARAVDYVQGSCLIVRKEAIDRIGGLDEGFFMYFEETDWCYRMHREGGEVWYVPDARVIHFGGGMTGHYDEQRLVYYYRGLKLFYRKHHGYASSLVVRVIIGFRAILRMVVWTLVGAFTPGLREAARSSARGYRRVLKEIHR